MNNTKVCFDNMAEKWIEESYESGNTVATRRLNNVLKVIEHHNPNSLIDIGCGDGRFLANLSKLDQKVGIDYSEKMIGLAKEQNPNIPFHQVDLNNGEISNSVNNLFEMATMMGVIHYLDNPSQTLFDIKNILTSKGLVVISFRNKLYNANEDSKYYKSPQNNSNLHYLLEEIELWNDFIQFIGNKPLKNILLNNEAKKCIDNILNNNTFQGITDNFWNPDNHKNWRQFTPLEAILLMSKNGFDTLEIIPLIEETTNNHTKDYLKHCSSFMIVAENKLTGDIT